MSHQRHHRSSTFNVPCFRPSPTADNNNLAPPSPPPQTSGKTNVATSLYYTSLGLFSLTWSRTFLGHSLHLHLHHPFSTLHFHLHIKPFIFWNKYGYKKLSCPTNVQVFWDLSRAKFGSGPEPDSGFYIAVVADGEMTFLVGDSTKEAYARIRAEKPGRTRSQALVLRRENVFGNQVHTTKAKFGGKNREISIDCRVNEDAKLCLSVDKKRVLQIKRLKWKFRGSERIEVDGVSIQVSWDVYNWLFHNNGHAVFMFKFETDGSENHDEAENDAVSWRQSSCSSFSMKGIEWRKLRKSFLRNGRSSSSSSILSMSSASSGGSVMEWESVEESELSAPIGFSLLVYAWKNLR